jgi:hypothetical protein
VKVVKDSVTNATRNLPSFSSEVRRIGLKDMSGSRRIMMRAFLIVESPRLMEQYGVVNKEVD